MRGDETRAGNEYVLSSKTDFKEKAVGVDEMGKSVVVVL